MKQQLIDEQVWKILQEEIADRVIYETHLGEETLRRGLQSAESRLSIALTTAYEAGRQSILDELAHEQKKLLDGFGHPKDCAMCLTPTDNNKEV